MVAQQLLGFLPSQQHDDRYFSRPRGNAQAVSHPHHGNKSHPAQATHQDDELHGSLKSHIHVSAVIVHTRLTGPCYISAPARWSMFRALILTWYLEFSPSMIRATLLSTIRERPLSSITRGVLYPRSMWQCLHSSSPQPKYARLVLF